MRRQRATERKFHRGEKDSLCHQLSQDVPAGDPVVEGDES